MTFSLFYRVRPKLASEGGLKHLNETLEKKQKIP